MTVQCGLLFGYRVVDRAVALAGRSRPSDWGHGRGDVIRIAEPHVHSFIRAPYGNWGPKTADRRCPFPI